MTWDKIWTLLLQGIQETVWMTLPSTLFAYVIGLPLGVLLVITRRGNILPAPGFNTVLGMVINFLRSIPFLILLVMISPVTRVVMGTAIGATSVIFPMVISAFPYVARMVESSLREVDDGVVEAALSMGSTTWQIIFKVLLPEALPSLVSGFTICLTTILAYTAMAGAAGGGGLGSIAISYGLNRRAYDIMYTASIALVLLVQIFQVTGTVSTKRLDHKKR
jgi:D-methionine transport system permease protein